MEAGNRCSFFLPLFLGRSPLHSSMIRAEADAGFPASFFRLFRSFQFFRPWGGLVPPPPETRISFNLFLCVSWGPSDRRRLDDAFSRSFFAFIRFPLYALTSPSLSYSRGDLSRSLFFVFDKHADITSIPLTRPYYVPPPPPFSTYSCRPFTVASSLFPDALS